MENEMHINWYPGHMVKSRRELDGKLKLIDLIIEVMDARAPLSTRNPDFDSLFKQKKRVYLLNKSDMADPAITKQWISYYKSQGIDAISFSALTGNPKDLLSAIKASAQEIYDKYAKKGMKKTVRILVAGIPNVGKSAILNRLYGQKHLKEGNKPGVTRGLQWVKLSPYLELMDSPGMLPPKIENPTAGAIIAAIGSIRTEILDEYQLTLFVLDRLQKEFPSLLSTRYKLEETALPPSDLLLQICKNRGFVLKGGELDYERGCRVILDEFKNAKIGRISLESPDQIESI